VGSAMESRLLTRRRKPGYERYGREGKRGPFQTKCPESKEGSPYEPKEGLRARGQRRQRFAQCRWRTGIGGGIGGNKAEWELEEGGGRKQESKVRGSERAESGGVRGNYLGKRGER